MARNSEETQAGSGAGTGASWLAPLFEMMKAKVEEATEVVCRDKIDTPEQAEKLGRRLCVIARAAKLVDAIRPRVQAESEEDGMGGRNDDPEEDERLRRELAAEFERLDAIIEAKRAETDAERGVEAGATQGEGAVASDFA